MGGLVVKLQSLLEHMRMFRALLETRAETCNIEKTKKHEKQGSPTLTIAYHFIYIFGNVEIIVFDSIICILSYFFKENIRLNV